MIRKNKEQGPVDLRAVAVACCASAAVAHSLWGPQAWQLHDMLLRMSCRPNC